MDLLIGNTFLADATLFGKTIVLQTIIRGIAESCTPEEVNMYLLDFASMSLKIFDGLKHVGGVVISSEDVKLRSIIVMIDSLPAFRELYEDLEDELIKLFREESAYGLSVIMTAFRARGITFKYMSNFPNRITMYCNAKDEYTYPFERCRMELSVVPGRALISIDKEMYEY